MTAGCCLYVLDVKAFILVCGLSIVYWTSPFWIQLFELLTCQCAAVALASFSLAFPFENMWQVPNVRNRVFLQGPLEDLGCVFTRKFIWPTFDVLNPDILKVHTQGVLYEKYLLMEKLLARRAMRNMALRKRRESVGRYTTCQCL